MLRKGIRGNGCKFQLAYFRPSSGLNEALQKLYAANQFTVVRQLQYSEKTGHSLDLTIFLNGLPIFTAELKNPLMGQNVENAIRQYRFDRDPREPFFAFGRCLAHFAVDPDLVYMTTSLEGAKTRFLPFNKGRNGGAGNPPSWKSFATAYLWEEVWARDSVLNLIQHFIHVVEDEDDKGRKTGTQHGFSPGITSLILSVVLWPMLVNMDQDNGISSNTLPVLGKSQLHCLVSPSTVRTP